jgi:hypothetical protein
MAFLFLFLVTQLGLPDTAPLIGINFSPRHSQLYAIKKASAKQKLLMW